MFRVEELVAHLRAHRELHDHESGPHRSPFERGPGGHGRGHGPWGIHGHDELEEHLGLRGRPRARRGDVRGAILSLLAEGPSNGYGLIKAIEEKSGGAWRPSPGSIYPTLQQLTDEGLIVASESEGGRTTYDLSNEGREHVEEHADRIEAAWGTTAASLREAFPIAVAIKKLVGVTRQVGMEGTPEQQAEAIEKIDNLRRELYRMLGE